MIVYDYGYSNFLSLFWGVEGNGVRSRGYIYLA